MADKKTTAKKRAASLTHLDDSGKARMVDVGSKPEMKRMAVAKGRIQMAEGTIRLIQADRIKKGDVLAVAKIAGLQAAKKTSELIPLCHPLLLTGIEISFTVKRAAIDIESRVESTGKTGVEMEALTAVAAAALTIYDMCKAVDKQMRIGDISLCQKSKQSV